jgi:hypothetical protein
LTYKWVEVEVLAVLWFENLKKMAVAEEVEELVQLK